MIYVTSDLHGVSLRRFLELLKSAGFGDEDSLFVLGDVIDRGSNGVELLRWMMDQVNVHLILGNHEAMMLRCDFLFQEVTEGSLESLTPENLGLVQTWLQNGASPTLDGMQRLLVRNPDIAEGILDYLRDAPLYDWVEAGGRSCLLVHSFPEDLAPGITVEELSPEELLWSRPRPDSRFDVDFSIILGHTPTLYLDPGCRGKAYHGDGWTCIDTGCPALPPMLLRLDDGAEFYLPARDARR